jgi:hypothetical protein
MPAFWSTPRKVLIGLSLAALTSACGAAAQYPKVSSGLGQGGGGLACSIPAIHVLKSMQALSASDVWGVGLAVEGTATAHPLIEHWDGHSWSRVVDSGLPYQPVSGASLAAVSADAPTDVWAAGEIDNGPSETLVEHWDGEAWHFMPTPKFNPPNAQLGVMARFDGILAFSPRDVWAAGTSWDELHGNIHRPLVEHWDGSIWHVITAPAPGANENEFSAIAGTSSSDIWAVGYAFSGPADDRPLVEHWDGQSWKVVASALGAGNRAPIGYLTSLAIHGADDIWAVGSKGRPGDPQAALAEHWNGHLWQMTQSPNVPAFGSGVSSHYLAAVSVSVSGDVWAVGMRGVQPLTGPVQPVIEHWDGTEWRVVPSPSVGPASGSLGAIVAAGPREAWATGGAVSKTCGAPAELVMERWDGASWQLIPVVL